jgi:hypothetical protein
MPRRDTGPRAGFVVREVAFFARSVYKTVAADRVTTRDVDHAATALVALPVERSRSDRKALPLICRDSYQSRTAAKILTTTLLVRKQRTML